MFQHTRQKIILAMLIAMGLIVFVFESFLPRPLPWIKPGLSNIASLLTLFWYGFPAAVLVTVFRIVLGALILGTLFNPVFLLSFGGGLAAILAMGALFWAGRKYFSLIGISVVGAFFHMLMQLVLATLIFIQRVELLQFLPVMLLSAVISGMIVGLISKILAEKLSFLTEN